MCIYICTNMYVYMPYMLTYLCIYVNKYSSHYFDHMYVYVFSSSMHITITSCSFYTHVYPTCAYVCVCVKWRLHIVHSNCFFV
jgi:hypothetical protein